MNASKLLVVSIMVGAVGAALTSMAWADENSPPLSRANVKAAVLYSRAHGQLLPAGEATQPDPAPVYGPARSHAEVRAEVLEARALGDLPRGEAATPFSRPSISTLTREEVRSEVRLATLQGELVPSGQGDGSVKTVARAPRGQTTIAIAGRR